MKLENVVGRSTEIGLRMFGIWPNSSCVFLRRLFWTVALMMEQIFQYRYVVVHFHSLRVSDMMNIFSETMAYAILLIKLAIFWCKQRTFHEILTMMAIDWETQCASAELGMLATTCKARLAQRFANLTVALYSIAVILYSSNILAQRADDDGAANASARALILKMELPFDYNRRFVYELVVIAQFIHLLLCSCAIGLLNALLLQLILHVIDQIDILRGWLMEIFPKEGKRGPGLVTMREAIRKHQKIIVFSGRVEHLYSDIALVLFVSDTLIICCLGFILVSSVGTADASKIIMRTVLFYLVMNLEAFVFCFAGEYLSTKSKAIGDAAYDSLWYEWDSKDSRIILLLMMRSQNQLVITIGKAMNLSLERFSSIVKASASYISVLLAMY